MGFLLSIVLFFTINVNPFCSNNSSNDVKVSNTVPTFQEAEDCITYIVMEDIIAIADSGNQDNLITYFKVYDNLKMDVVYETTGCENSVCSFDLGQLSTGYYFAEIMTKDGKSYGNNISIQ